MAALSGLAGDRRIRARERAVQAALLAYHHRDQINYTQGSNRWEGIAQKRNARLGQFPKNADCSAMVTWCLWNGLHLGFQLGDVVNGARWTGGFTGTLLEHGKLVSDPAKILRGDVVIYGAGKPGKHTAIVVGRRKDGKPMVVSHGSQNGPFYLPYDYRRDVMQVRRYI